MTPRDIARAKKSKPHATVIAFAASANKCLINNYSRQQNSTPSNQRITRKLTQPWLLPSQVRYPNLAIFSLTCTFPHALGSQNDRDRRAGTQFRAGHQRSDPPG